MDQDQQTRLARIVARMAQDDESLPDEALTDVQFVGSSGLILHGGDAGLDSRLAWLIEQASLEEVVAELVAAPWSLPVEDARDFAQRLQRARE